MKLILSQNQSKGMMGMGSVNFEVKAQVQLTPEEQDLIRHYKLENEVVLNRPELYFGQPTGEKIQVTVKQLLNGEALKCRNLNQVLEYTEGAKSACENLKVWLEVAAQFGGQEVIEY